MRKTISSIALVGTAMFVSSGWLTCLANAVESPILEPASGAWLGLYFGAGSVDQTSAKLGRPPRIHLTYYSWADDWTGNTTKADLAAGRIPLVNWEPAKIDFAKFSTVAWMQRFWRAPMAPKSSERSSFSTSPPR
jgi:hypothetical protein